MGAVRGKDFKLYRNSSVYATPTWVEITNVKDLTRSVEKSLADASTRGSTFRQQLGTLKDLSIEFQMVYDQDDTNYVELEDAFYDDSDIGFLILDGPVATVGSKGIRFTGQVTNFSTNEALEDVGMTDVTIVPSYDATNPPEQFTVPTPP